MLTAAHIERALHRTRTPDVQRPGRFQIHELHVKHAWNRQSPVAAGEATAAGGSEMAVYFGIFSNITTEAYSQPRRGGSVIFRGRWEGRRHRMAGPCSAPSLTAPERTIM